jgi:nitroreductase
VAVRPDGSHPKFRLGAMAVAAAASGLGWFFVLGFFFKKNFLIFKKKSEMEGLDKVLLIFTFLV